jgi:hypothetical protein
MGLLSQLPLDVFDGSPLFHLWSLAIRRLGRHLPVLEATFLQHPDEPARRIGIALVLGGVEAEVHKLAEVLSFPVILAVMALATYVEVQADGDVDRVVEVLFASLELATSSTGNVLARLHGGFRIPLLVAEVEGEMTASLEQCFFGGLGVGQSFFEPGIAVPLRDILELGLLASTPVSRVRPAIAAALTLASQEPADDAPARGTRHPLMPAA